MKLKTRFLLLGIMLLFPVFLFAQKQGTETDTTKHVVQSNSDIYYSQTLSGAGLSTYIDNEFPNSVSIPGTNIRFAIGGYVKTDFIVDLDYVGNRSEFVTSTIALDGSPESSLGGQTTFHSKETRMSFDFHSKTKSGIPMRAYIEFDFFASQNPYNYTPRYRIATITIGRLTIGQNWITAMDLNAMPTTIDFEFGDALVNNRATQIRYEQTAGKQFKWAVAIESPNTSIDNPFGLEGESRQYMPNLTGKIIWTHKIGHLQLAGFANQPRWAGSSFGTTSNLGGGFHFTGALNFLKYDKFMWALAYGKGWAQNVAAFSGSGADVVLNADGSLTTIPVLNISAGIEHYWASNVASTLSFNWAELDSPADKTNTSQEMGATAHANVRWLVFKRFGVGLEYMAGKLRIVDGTTGFAQRLQFAAKLHFTD